MKIFFVFFGIAVLVVVLANAEEAKASREELLDELTERMLVRYLDRRNLDIDARYPTEYERDQQGYFNQGPERRWWGGKNYHHKTTNSQKAHNTGNINGNMINGGVSAGSISGSNQGRK